jgi:hypothetical protein
MSAIPGYRFGDPSLPQPTVDGSGLAQLQAALLMTEADIRLLRDAAAIMDPHIEELLDTWYAFVGSQPALLASFSTPSGPDAAYLGAVRTRFAQWVRDTLRANFDDDWLAYQDEIGRRHAGAKNQTDGVRGAPEVVPLRYLIALIYPIFTTVRPILARGARDDAHLDQMHHAWLKAVILSVSLWAGAYTRPEWF